MPHVEQELFTIQGHLSSSPIVYDARVAQSLVFCAMFCRSLFVFLFFFFCPLSRLSRLLDDLLVFYNLSSILRKKNAILLLQTSLNHIFILRYENYQFATNHVSILYNIGMIQALYKGLKTVNLLQTALSFVQTLKCYRHYIKVWKLSISYKQLSVLCKH